MHVTGCYHYRGAALLAAKAAVYTGSGLVTVWSNEKVIDALSLFCPEATSCQDSILMNIYYKGKRQFL